MSSTWREREREGEEGRESKKGGGEGGRSNEAINCCMRNLRLYVHICDTATKG